MGNIITNVIDGVSLGKIFNENSAVLKIIKIIPIIL